MTWARSQSFRTGVPDTRALSSPSLPPSLDTLVSAVPSHACQHLESWSPSPQLVIFPRLLSVSLEPCLWAALRGDPTEVPGPLCMQPAWYSLCLTSSSPPPPLSQCQISPPHLSPSVLGLVLFALFLHLPPLSKDAASRRAGEGSFWDHAGCGVGGGGAEPHTTGEQLPEGRAQTALSTATSRSLDRCPQDSGTPTE